MELYDTALVLTRVLVSGVVMSIEKSDRELPALARALVKRTGRGQATLFNSRTAAVHAALAGAGIGFGDIVSLPDIDRNTLAFVNWLGIRVTATGPAAFEQIRLNSDNLDQLSAFVQGSLTPVLVVDLTDLGFGPAAALITDDPVCAARAERLKIFGAHDLRTMWTQQESDPDLIPGVQFNYRLSPLVAACVRMALTVTEQPTSEQGARA